jgi:hypothetical protein
MRVSFQKIKTWNVSNDPAFEVIKKGVLHLFDIAGERQRP